MSEERLTKKELKKMRKLEKQKERMKEENNKSYLKWVIGALISIVVVLGFWKMSQSSEVVSTDPWVKGSQNPVVVIDEYSDFQCPACGAAAPILKQTIEKYGDKVQLRYHHYPLISIHANALPAARAAEAAGVQGKFWEMHDKLFETQTAWSTGKAEDKFYEYAGELGLNVEKFKQDYKSKDLLKKIQLQRTIATNAGFNSTPTIIVNGEKIVNPASFADFEIILAQFLGEPTPEATDSAELEIISTE